MYKPDASENLLTCCKHVGAKDKPADHDWSLYLRSITRVCMERLNSVEIRGRYKVQLHSSVLSSVCNKYLDLWKYLDFSVMYIVFNIINNMIIVLIICHTWLIIWITVLLYSINNSDWIFILLQIMSKSRLPLLYISFKFCPDSIFWECWLESFILIQIQLRRNVSRLFSVLPKPHSSM